MKDDRDALTRHLDDRASFWGDFDFDKMQPKHPEQWMPPAVTLTADEAALIRDVLESYRGEAWCDCGYLYGSGSVYIGPEPRHHPDCKLMAALALLGGE